MCKCFQTEQDEIRRRMNKWFDSQYSDVEKDKNQIQRKVTGSFIVIKKSDSYRGSIGLERSYLEKKFRSQIERTKMVWARGGWNWDNYNFRFPFHEEETDNLLAIAWVMHMWKVPKSVLKSEYKLRKELKIT